MARRGLPILLLVLAAALVVYGLLAEGLGPARTMECTLAERGIVPEGASPFPPVSEGDWTWGPEDARVTLVAYLDLECRRSAELAAALRQLRYDYPDDVRLVYRHFPLETLHDKARLAAQAVEAAGAQGQFWPMHDLLFEQQGGWTQVPVDLFPQWLAEQAEGLGLDAERFGADLESQQTLGAVQRAYEEAIGLGLNGTPSMAINGQYYEGPMDAWTLAAYVDLIKLEERQFQECPQIVTRGRRQHTATLHTTRGDITIRLLPEQAPLAVNNFVFLARQGWYDGVAFHRVIPEYVVQTGDPSGTGMGGPGYTFSDEIVPGALFDRAGVVGMAGSGRDGNGSQFFITYGPQPSLDGQHTIFGEVVAGMDVAVSLTPRDPVTDPTGLPEPDRILSVEITER